MVKKGIKGKKSSEKVHLLHCISGGWMG